MLRKATDADIPALMAIRASVTENALGDPSKVLDVHYQWFIANPGIFIWKEKGKVAGFSAADPRNGSIWALFVAQRFEQRGIGSILLENACEILKAAGIRRAWLATDPGTRAERFYRNAGWEAVAIQDGELRFERIL